MTATIAPIEQRIEACRNLFRLDGKTALVLGAASGIGKACAEALAALGATVICADKNRDGVETTAAEISTHGRAEANVVDAGNAEDINALAAAIETNHKRLDVAVTTPAIHVRKLMCDYNDEEYNRVADLNPEICPLCSRAVLKIEKLRASNRRSSRGTAGRRAQAGGDRRGDVAGYRPLRQRRAVQRAAAKHPSTRISPARSS